MGKLTEEIYRKGFRQGESDRGHNNPKPERENCPNYACGFWDAYHGHALNPVYRMAK